MSRNAQQKDKDKNQLNQAFLLNLLKDEDNKYCVDCDAKGPRWASWNLGIFLCIRCAGIHRNLGVHISKVKSVNLDTWTAEQMVMVKEMGNSRGRAVYEANIPDNFRRPQSSDTEMEIFIRDKYERKLYIAKEWVPPQLKSLPSVVVDERKEKKKKPKKQMPLQINSAPRRPASTEPKKTPLAAQAKSLQSPKPSSTGDLLGLDVPSNGVNTSPSANNDPFGDFLSPPAAITTSAAPETNGATTTEATATSSQQTSTFNDLSSLTTSAESSSTKSMKDSIMALYGSSNNAPSVNPVYGVPGGMYIPQQQIPAQHQQQQYMPTQMMPGNMGLQQNGAMMQNQANMMVMPGAYPGMPQQQQMMPGMQPNMMGMPPQQHTHMMPGQMPAQYNMASQHHLEQIQQQMAAMKVGGMVPNQQMGGLDASAGWGGPPGQTLSNNLWQ